MTEGLARILAVASGQLLRQTMVPIYVPGAPSLARELNDLLAARNGFYAFESALHMFPSGPSSAGTMTLERWNSDELWRNSYGDLANGFFFLAEDVFGGQFAVKGDRIWTFDPETAQTKPMASSLEAWARALLDDYEVLTGYPIAREWQALHGPLKEATRLMPKTPFVLGGGYTIANLAAVDAVQAMRLRGDMATQIRDLPEGAAIRLKIVD